MTLYACTSEKAPRPKFLATYDLSSGSPRKKKNNEIRENPRKSTGEAKNPRAGGKPGFQHLPTYRRSYAPCIFKTYPANKKKKMLCMGVQALHDVSEKKTEGESREERGI